MINILKRIKWLNIIMLVACIVSGILGVVCFKESYNLILYGNPTGTNLPLFGFMLSFVVFSATLDYIVHEFNED